MSRTLHFAITETGGCCRASGAQGVSYGGGRRLGDPGDGPKTAELENPGEGPKTAQLEDPGDGPKTAQLENPVQDSSAGGGYGGSGGYSGHGGHSGSSGCGCPQWQCVPLVCGEGGGQTAQQAAAAALGPIEYSGFIILRLAQAVLSNPPPPSLWQWAKDRPLPGLRAVLETPVPASAVTEQPSPGGTNLRTLPPGPKAPSVEDPQRPAPIEAAGLSRREVFGHLDSDSPPAGTLVSRPLIDLAGWRCDVGSSEALHAKLRALEAQAAQTDFPPLHSLTAFYRVDARHLPDQAEELVARFAALPEVEVAYRELASTDATNGATAFGSMQGYLEAAPEGIDARWAVGQLGDTLATVGSGAELVDLEQGWIFEHEELATKFGAYSPLVGANRHDEGGYLGHHGTAVLGQILSEGTSNLDGLLPGLGTINAASHFKKAGYPPSNNESLDEPYPFADTNGHVAEAIAALLLPEKQGLVDYRGRVLLLEVQRGRLPTEVDLADCYAIRLATALGVTVVEAAGNRGFDLDAYVDEQGRRRLSRTSGDFVDSGAIMVGAARADLPHDRAAFSNYGSRLDCYGWGETVTSCGYGDLDAGAATAITQFYTSTFNGTSSASPIIAGAAVLLLCLYRDRACFGGDKVWLSPLRVRALLADPQTGTPQGPNVGGRIGVMPDLRRIVEERLKLVPNLYLRRFVGDDTPGVGGVVHGSSPDILLLAGAWDQSTWDAIHPNEPAPGAMLVPAAHHTVAVRGRNRGLAEAGGLKARLYFCPTATLITPEQWKLITPKQWQEGDPLSTVLVSEVAADSGLVAMATVDWEVPAADPNEQFFAFLASIGFGGDDPVPMPPAMPYFRWDVYRDFVRHDGVAIRNVHWVKVGAQPEIRLPFYVTGTPDRSRDFDFQIIRRMSPQAGLELQGPKALIAAMHQRRPWIERFAVAQSQPQEYGLKLPAEQVLAFRRLRVPVCARLPTRLVVTAPAQISTGDSVIVRQLFRGEEVGRITWIFQGS